jgi:hypothetical protein
MQANTHGPVSSDLLEVKGRMSWVVLEKLKGFVGELPYG